MRAIRIKPGEHVSFLGCTGSGKTVLAKRLLAPLNRVIVVDPKDEYHSRGYKRKMHLSLLEKEFKLIWAPSRSQDGKLADLLYKALGRKNLTIYIDEMQSLTDFFPQATEAITEIIRTGRSRKVALWWASQRPAWIPRFLLSESRHKFVFTLLDRADRKRASDVIGDMGRDIVKMHTFLYHTVGLDRAEKLTYNMKKGVIVRITPAKDAGT